MSTDTSTDISVDSRSRVDRHSTGTLYTAVSTKLVQKKRKGIVAYAFTLLWTTFVETAVYIGRVFFRLFLLISNNKLNAPVSQLVNAEVNSGNRKAVLASNYATRIRGRHAALRECIMYKQLNYTRSDSLRYAKQRKGGHVRSFGGFVWLPIDKKASSFSSKNLPDIFFPRVVVVAE